MASVVVAMGVPFFSICRQVLKSSYKVPGRLSKINDRKISGIYRNGAGMHRKAVISPSGAFFVFHGVIHRSINE